MSSRSMNLFKFPPPFCRLAYSSMLNFRFAYLSTRWDLIHHLSSILLTQCTFEPPMISVESWPLQLGFLKLYIILPENIAPEKLALEHDPASLWGPSVYFQGRTVCFGEGRYHTVGFMYPVCFPKHYPLGRLVHRSLRIWCEFPQSILYMLMWQSGVF